MIESNNRESIINMNEPIAYFMGNRMYTNLYYSGGLSAGKMVTFKFIGTNTIWPNASILIRACKGLVASTFESIKPIVAEINKQMQAYSEIHLKPILEELKDIKDIKEYYDKVYPFESEKVRCDWVAKKKVNFRNLFSRKQNRKLLKIRSNC